MVAFSVMDTTDIVVLNEQESLPNGMGIEFDFPILSQGTFAVLYSDENACHWVEASTPLERQELAEVLTRTTGDGLYKLVRNDAGVFFPVLTTDKTGVFVFVSK